METSVYTIEVSECYKVDTVNDLSDYCKRFQCTQGPKKQELGTLNKKWNRRNKYYMIINKTIIYTNRI